MKQTSKRVLSLFMALTMLIGMMSAVTVGAAEGWTAIVGPYDINLGAEEVITDTWTQANNTTISADVDPADTGNKVLKLVTTADNQRVTVKASVPFETGKQYKISFKIKAASGTTDVKLASAAKIYMDYTRSWQIDDGDKQGEQTREKLDAGEYYGMTATEGATTSWQTLSYYIDVEEAKDGATATALYIQPTAAGTYYIDDYTVSEWGEIAEPVVEYVDVTVSASENGSVQYKGEAVNGSFQIEKGSDVTLTIVPDEGYEAAVVTVDGAVATVVNNTLTLEDVTAAKSVVVAFSKIKDWEVIEGPYNFNFAEGQSIDDRWTKGSGTTISAVADPDNVDNNVMQVVTEAANKRVTTKYSLKFEDGTKYKVTAKIKAAKATDVKLASSAKLYMDYTRYYQIGDGEVQNTQLREKYDAGEYYGQTIAVTEEWETYSWYIDVAKANTKSGATSQLYLEPAAAGTIYVDDFSISAIKPLKAPYVKSVVIDGIPQIKTTLTANAVVADDDEGDEATATYQWQEKNGDDWVDIKGETKQTYYIPETMLGKVVRVLVTPVSNNQPSPGVAFPSEPTIEILEFSYPPSGERATITGNFEIGEWLKADFTYIPSESGFGPGTHDYIWEVSTNNVDFNAIPGFNQQRYKVRVADAGMWLRVKVIPKDKNGIPGEPVYSEATKIDGSVSFYVSTTGDDNNDGTFNEPFKTIEKARDTLRTMPVLPEGGVTVYIMGGTYPVSSTIQFTEEDSGTKESPITYQAYNNEEVSFVGGKVLNASNIKKVEDKELLNNLIEEEARDHLYMLDLGKEGVTMDPLGKRHNVSNTKDVRLYFNNNLLTEARWPNDDQSQNMIKCRPLTKEDGIDENKINAALTPLMFEFPDPENRSAKWNIKEGDAFIGGALVHFWAHCQLRIESIDLDKKIVTSLDPNSYASVKDVQWGANYLAYFSNIFAEIDKPGESYVDREKNILYFYPVGSVENAEIIAATLKKNMITMNGTSYVNFKGINFKDSVNTAVVLNNCDNIIIQDGEISNISEGGIEAVNSTNVLITGNNFYSIGQSAIVFDGGDRENLVKSGNEVANNNFHSCAFGPIAGNTVIDITNAAGEWIHHNAFDDMPGYVIRMFYSNDILIEYNKFSNSGYLNTDAGLINWGREADSLGHTIRYNYFEEIGSTLVSNYFNSHQSVSIFTDDTSTGGHIYGNIFFNAGSDSGGTGSAIQGNGPEFANVWGNIAIATDFDKMDASFLMRSWNNNGIKNSYGVKTNTNQALRSWLYQMAVGTTYGSTSSNYYQASDLDLMWSDEWRERYAGTIWEPVLDHYSEKIHEAFMEKYNDGDYAGALQVLCDNLVNERTNKIHDNVSIGATRMDSLADHYNNYVGTQHKITEDDKALFVDFDNKNFNLAPGALEKIQAKSPEFEKLPDFNTIGLLTDFAGSKPVVTVNEELYTGVAAAGNDITVSYTFSDADGDLEANSKVYWYICDTEDGKFEKIYGVEGKTLEVTDDYSGRFLKYEVLPYDTSVTRGDMVMSGAISVRKAGAVDISGLVALITEAQELLSKAVIGDEAEQYPQDAADKFQAAIAKANEVANNENALKYQVVKAEEEITTAIEEFKRAKISSLANIDVEKVSINTLLKDKDNWAFSPADAQYEFKEDGSLVFSGNNTLAAYTGKLYKNAEFTFKFKAEVSNPGEGDDSQVWVGVYFRQNEPNGLVWNKDEEGQARNGFMLDLKQNLIQLQEWPYPKAYANTLLNDKYIEMGREYVATAGLYDIPDSNELLFIFTLDGETIYSQKFEDNGLYGNEGYFAINAGKNGGAFGRVTLSPYYAETTKLETAIESAAAFTESIVIGDGYGEYSAAAVEKLQAAIEKAEKAMENVDAVQSDIDEALTEVQKAMSELKASASPSGTIEEDGTVSINYNYPNADLTFEKDVKDVTIDVDPTEPQPEINLESDDVEMTIPQFSIVSGDFKAPLPGTSPSGTFTGGTVSKVYGQGSAAVSVDQPVRIVLKGEADKNVAYKDTNGKYTFVMKTIAEDSTEAAAAVLDNQKFKVVKTTVGDDVVIYTYLLTEFLTYDAKSDDSGSDKPVAPIIPTPGKPQGGISTGIIGGSNNSSDDNKATTTTSNFGDIVGHWAENDIKEMAEKGIVSGVTATTFEPDRSITRAEFAALMTRALRLTAANTDAVFADVASNEWYADEVAAAAAAGLIVGYDGNFRPNDTITREEMAVIIMKAYTFLGKAPLTGKIDKFADKGAISTWAVSYVDQAVSSGLISGITEDTFAPAENATRAQVTSLIKRLLNS